MSKLLTVLACTVLSSAAHAGVDELWKKADIQEICHRAKVGYLQEEDFGNIKQGTQATAVLACIFEGGHDDFCETQTPRVTRLLSMGAKPAEAQRSDKQESNLFHNGFTTQHGSEFSLALKRGCPEMAAAMLKSMTADDVQLGLENSPLLFSSSTSRKVPSERYFKYRAVITALGKAADEKCQSDPEFCPVAKEITDNEAKRTSEEKAAEQAKDEKLADEAQQKLASEAKYKRRQSQRQADQRTEAAQVAKAAAFEKSPDGTLKHICEEANTVSTMDQLIAHEHAVTKETGVENQSSLYQLGTGKLAAKHELEKLKEQYKKQAGHDADLSKCKIEKLDM